MNKPPVSGKTLEASPHSAYPQSRRSDDSLQTGPEADGSRLPLTEPDGTIT